MTGQLHFDSHTSDVVTTAVQSVNLLTPGYALGREYDAANPGAELRAQLRPRWLKRDVNPSDREVEQLRAYAVRLRTVFAAVDDGRIDDACHTVNSLLQDTHAAPVLDKHDDEPWHLHFHAVTAGWARSWAASMATSLAIVLGNPMYDRLGVCTASACDRVFVDTSRNGTKRFCSISCQNRIKTAAFRARQSSAQPK